MKKLLFAVAFMFLAQISMAQTAAKPADPALKKEAVRLLELSGINAQYEALLEPVIKNVPADKQAAFKKDLTESLVGLKDKMADLYLQEFTAEDIKGMIKYFESPVGKKAASKIGVLTSKGQAIGAEWGQGLQAIMMKYME